MLLPRILSALIGIPLLLYLIHMGSWPFLVLVVGLAMLALHEYATLLRLGGRPIQHGIAVLGGGGLALTVGLGASGEGAPVDMAYIALTGVVLAALLREMLRPEHSLDRAASTVFGVLFIGWTLPHLVLLRELRPFGERLTYFLFLSIWVTDIAAYAAGTTLGRRPLAPLISPKKTWEGLAAGLAACAVFALLARQWFLPDVFSPIEALLAGIFIGAMGQTSDLAKSVIKRAVGAKDSSALLPGHGGILDRFDAFLLTTPFLYYALAFKLR